MKTAIIRLVAILGLCAAIWWRSITVAFRYPDQTWARRWIDHPDEMSVEIVLLLAMLVVYFWPSKDKR